MLDSSDTPKAYVIIQYRDYVKAVFLDEKKAQKYCEVAATLGEDLTITDVPILDYLLDDRKEAQHENN